MRRFAPQKKTLFAAALLAAAALLCECGLLALRRAREPAYEAYAVSAADCGAWAMEQTADGYALLVNNSYFYYDFPAPAPACEVTVRFSRDAADDTETVLYCTGTAEGITGEFVYALRRVAEGVYRADVSLERLTALRIFPSENGGSTVSFGGFTVNEVVSRPAFSAGELLCFGFGFAFIYHLYIAIKNKRSGAPLPSLWVGVWLGAGTVAAAGCYAATRLFTSASQLGDLLPLAACAGVSALFAAVRFAASRRTLAGKAAVLAAVLSLCFCFASAPLQAPDETTHYLRAYALSQGEFGFDNGYAFPDDVLWLCDLFNANFYDEVIATGRGNALTVINEYQAAVAAGETGRQQPTHIQLLVPYAAAALLMAPVRALGGGALALLYAGRLANAAVYVLAVWFALRRAKRWRFALLAAAFWPLTVFMCASLSYDSLYLSLFLALLGTALGGAPERRDALLFCGLLAGMVAIKPISLVLLPLVFLLEGGWKRWARIAALAVACSAALYFGTLAYASLAAVGMAREPAPEGVDIAGQMRYVLGNPLRYLAVMLIDGYENGFYLGQAGLFGWLDAPTILTPVLAPAAVVAVSLFGAGEARRRRRGEPLLFLLTAALTYAVTVTGFYCIHSTLGATSILGVQARYLIPCLPLLSGALASGCDRLGLAPQAARERSEAVSLWLLASVALLAAGELFLCYFLT